MIYKFLILSDEVDNFVREIEINSDATFLELNNAILASVDYQTDQMTSFFHCMNGWEKYEEITLVEMDTNSENDSFTMDSTHIDEFVTDEEDRLMFVFDILTERAFFIELKEMKSGALKKAQCVRAQGKAPKQITSEEEFLQDALGQSGKGMMLDDDFYGDTGFNEDELESEGLDDFSFEEQ